MLRWRSRFIYQPLRRAMVPTGSASRSHRYEGQVRPARARGKARHHRADTPARSTATIAASSRLPRQPRERAVHGRAGERIAQIVFAAHAGRRSQETSLDREPRRGRLRLDRALKHAQHLRGSSASPRRAATAHRIERWRSSTRIFARRIARVDAVSTSFPCACTARAIGDARVVLARSRRTRKIAMASSKTRAPLVATPPVLAGYTCTR